MWLENNQMIFKRKVGAYLQPVQNLQAVGIVVSIVSLLLIVLQEKQ